ncbi:hypothetical protein AB205_0018780 [Aquarana catesbeiana]|uniref:Armadillo repeat-containing domain-containing protein n=1 Tax=Aquarana catesbeiana TaxID=8400 RepID=A0A2G9SDA9_AQUCT|nr:hypothetical protein AB205_0018780 [Aquarana catesbeiana]
MKPSTKSGKVLKWPQKICRLRKYGDLAHRINNNFLQHFLCLSWPKGGNKSLSHLANLWLKFLWNLSLSSDGQLMIMKMKGSLEIILELTKYKQKVKFPMVLLILHNICFNPANKPKILSNDETGLEDRHEVYHLKCLENLEQVLAN